MTVYMRMAAVRYVLLPCPAWFEVCVQLYNTAVCSVSVPAASQGSRPLADFTAHIALNPNREGGKHSKACNKQQQQEAPAQSPDALVISTIHAAKGLEYNTVWVPRWVQGFLPTMPRK